MGEATAFSLAWTGGANQFAERMSSRPNHLKALYEIQESFVALHEVFHCIYETNEYTREKCHAYFAERVRSSLLDYQRALEAIGISVDGLSGEGHSALICELSCDALAIGACLKSFLLRGRISPEVLARTLIWGIGHLCWLDELESYLAQYVTNSDSPEERRFSPSTLSLTHRMTLAGYGLAEACVDLMHGSVGQSTRLDMIESLAQNLSVAAKEHAKLFDPDLSWIGKRLKLVKTLNLDGKYSRDWKEVSREIDVNTGWGANEREGFPVAWFLGFSE